MLGLGLRAYAVAHPVANPADDSHAYYGLAKALYEEGSYGGPNFRDSSDWSPGAPLLYAAAFFVTGGAREGTARIVEALMGTAAILVVFASRAADAAGRGGEATRGRADSTRPLAACRALAVYPPFIHSTGELMSSRRRSSPCPPRSSPSSGRATARTGLALARPRLPLRPDRDVPARVPVRRRRLPRLRRDPALPGAAVRRPALAGAGCAAGARSWSPIVPWTVRNYVVLERVVPISTGSGKALYVGTYLPADGEYQRVKALLYERYEGESLAPELRSAERSRPDPALRPGRQRNKRTTPDLPARLGPRQGRQAKTSPSTSAKTRSATWG